MSQVCDLTWSELQKCRTIEGNHKIPLLEDVMKETKGKIFMNLEIKDNTDEIWDKIKELIEKYQYYDQISICSFKKKVSFKSRKIQCRKKKINSLRFIRI